ncbi:MAG: hypothetical protein ACFFCS_29080 [Candidatus Hodarchaeota archaeon]
MSDEASERMQGIWGSIKALKAVRNELIEFLEKTTPPTYDPENLENVESTRKIWISDVQSLYNNIISAWEMLRGVLDGNLDYAQSCKMFLSGAESRSKQVSSELKAFKLKEAADLDLKYFNSYKKCQQEILNELEPYIEKVELKKPDKKVIKISGDEYHLPCSVCSKVSVKFRIGIPRFDKEDKLIFEGITHSRGFSLEHAVRVFSWLQREEISNVHEFFIEEMKIFEGLDAYCPKCDAIYCYTHYNAQEFWDEGFYDYTEGRCPNGHVRDIDD